MKTLLLAAGLGTRLRPITETIPKCLVLINGKPLLEYWLEELTKVGISEFLINTHYLHKKVEEFIENSIYKDKVTLVYEDELLGTGSTILENKDFFNENNPFMVIHADNYCLCDFKNFLSAHENKPKSTLMTMMTFTTDTPQSCGIVKLDKKNIVIEFHEKVDNPPSNLANGAVYIFDYEVVDILEKIKQKNIDLSIDLIPKLINKINTFHNSNIHIDIGTINNLKKAKKAVKKCSN